MDIRDANEGDIDFLAWVMLEASRSHLARGVWEYVHDHDEDKTLDFLRRLASTDVIHFFHPSLFMIAEVDGNPAAALCGFDHETQGMSALWQVMPSVLSESGIVLDEGFMRRGSIVGMVTSDYAPGAWVVENVATRPEFRRRGLVRELLDLIFERGRANRFDLAQISVFIGNEPARNAYLAAGFESKDEKRDPTFEKEFGCPGMERLLRPL